MLLTRVLFAHVPPIAIAYSDAAPIGRSVEREDTHAQILLDRRSSLGELAPGLKSLESYNRRLDPDI